MGESHRFVVCLSFCVLASAPAFADDLKPSDLGWPADTTMAAFKERASVRASAGRGDRIASVAKGTRVAFRRIVATTDGCKGWLELERGWACATDLAPAPVGGDEPSARASDHFADITAGGAEVYADLDALRAHSSSKHLPEKSYVALRGSVQVVDGARYFYTDQGWIAGKDMAMTEMATFAGIELPPAAKLDFGWAVAKQPGDKIPVRETPDDKAKIVKQLYPRDLVTIREIQGDWARIGDHEWTLAVELRKPQKQARPEGVGPKERWIDVDLDQQYLMAYDGDTPVFVTLVSTGRPGMWGTPTGIYRIRDKAPVARMQYTPPEVIPGVTEQWDVRDVPYVMGFRKNFALHGTYWHDGFGRQRSHGCVNLSPLDARTVYDFVLPVAPEGYSEVESEGDGTPVRIRAHWDPSPKWRDFNGDAVKSGIASK